MAHEAGSVNLSLRDPSEPVPSQARGVNASGVITGYATWSGGFKRVVTWTPDGSIQDLGIAGFSQTYGVAINNAGQIAAYGDARDTQQYKEHAGRRGHDGCDDRPSNAQPTRFPRTAAALGDRRMQ